MGDFLARSHIRWEVLASRAMNPPTSWVNLAETLSDRMELSLRYLQAQLARIAALLRRQVRRWQTAGPSAADPFRGLYISDGEAGALNEDPAGGRHWLRRTTDCRPVLPGRLWANTSPK